MECEKEIEISKETNLNQVIGKIREFAIQASFRPEIIEIAKKAISEKEPLKFTFDEVYSKIYYESDNEDIQLVKAAHCTLKQGFGNCVDYSIVIAGILIRLKIPFFFKVVSYEGKEDFSHIYIVTDKGIILDPVVGQNQDGTDCVNRPIKGQFNKELPYKYKKLFNVPRLLILQGTLRNGNNKLPISRNRMIRGGYNNIKIQGNWFQNTFERFGNFIEEKRDSLDPNSKNLDYRANYIYDNHWAGKLFREFVTKPKPVPVVQDLINQTGLPNNVNIGGSEIPTSYFVIGALGLGAYLLLKD